MSRHYIDRTAHIKVFASSLLIPADVLGVEMDLIINVDDIRWIRLYSDIEPIAGVDAVHEPSSGPGVYPRTEYTQTVYFALEIMTGRNGKIFLNRLMDRGSLDCLLIAETIEDRMGIEFESIDDCSGRSYAATGTMVILIIAILGIVLGG